MAARKKKPQAKRKDRRSPSVRFGADAELTREIFEQFMDHLPAATFIKDAEGRVFYFNRFMRDVLGAKDSWLGKRTTELWPGPMGETMQRDDEAALRAGFTEREEAVPGTDGIAREYHTQKFVIPREGQDPLLGGIALDITKRNETLRALAASEAKLRAVFDGAGDGIVLAEVPTGKIAAVNQRFADSLGYRPEELVGQTIYKLHPPEDADMIRAEFAKNSRGEVVLSPELRIVRKDGTIFFADIGSAVIPLPEGTICMGVFRDATERRASKQALSRSEERFRVIFENAPFGVVLVDSAGHTILSNRSFRAMLGYSAEQISGMRLSEFTHPDDVAATEDLFQQIFRGERESYRIEKRYIRADGRIVWGGVAAAIVREHDETPAYVIGMVEDITDRKRIEQELQDIQAKMLQTQKLESLGVLAGGIAHDFNNLLMAIVGHAEVFLDEIPKDSRLLASAREIEIASRRGAELCRQMLTYAGRAKPTVESTDVNEIVVEMSRLLEASVSKGAEIVYRPAKNLPPIRVDATQIRQILMNLVANASEALADGVGKIFITTGAKRCDRAYLAGSYIDDGLSPGDYVFIEVTDTGCGMDEATIARIFDPFFTTKFAGRGLGLASVLGIARGNSGTIRVRSAPAEGSTFTVLFPATFPATPTGVPVIPSAPEWRGSGTVLVIDDETGVRSVTARHLEKSGFQVLSAESGQRGLDLLVEHPEIGMVILDLAMPQMAGDVCFKRIREFRPGLPVIMTSGYDEAGVAERMPGAPISGFLQKPFKRGELLAVVRHILGDESLRCEP